MLDEVPRQHGEREHGRKAAHEQRTRPDGGVEHHEGLLDGEAENIEAVGIVADQVEAPERTGRHEGEPEHAVGERHPERRLVSGGAETEYRHEHERERDPDIEPDLVGVEIKGAAEEEAQDEAGRAVDRAGLPRARAWRK